MTSSTSQGANKRNASSEVITSSDLAKARELSKKARDLAKVGKLEEAIALFEEALAIYPNNAEIIADYAKAMRDAGKHSIAGELFEKCLKLEPDSIKNIFSYIKSLNNQKNFARVFELFDYGLKLEPNNIILMSAYGRAAAMSGAYKKSNELFEQCLRFSKNNIPTLNSYANALVEQEKYQRAFELFEYSLQLDRNHVRTLTCYANALVRQGQYQRASELFEQCLKLDGNDIRTLTSYANELVRQEQYQRSNELFEQCLKLDRNNVHTLTSYSNALVQQEQYQRAFELFEQCLQSHKNNIPTLNSYANALVQQEQYQRAFELFEHSLQLDGNHVPTLNSYANALVQQGQYQRAFELFEHSLQLDGNDVRTLTCYANASVQQGQYQRAFELFERSLKLDGNHVRTLTYYANALVQQGQYQHAFELFEHSLQLDGNDVHTLTFYANALEQSSSWQRLIELRPDNSYARLQYAQQLEAKGDLKKALTQLLSIDLSSQKPYHANIIRLNLGRLYYRLGQADLGKQFFDEAITNSDEQDKTILYAARSLLATNPNSQEAINLLLKIQEDSPRYAEAMKAIALNADAETSYELFGADEEQIDDIEMLYRAMYHKIGNEIAVLRSISNRLLRRMQGEHPLVKEIVNDFEKLQQGIASQRANEKAAIAGIAPSNYKQLIEIVSKTAHDISDEVNNQLAVIESKTRRAMRKLTAEDQQYQQFEKLILQLKITQKAINDLKSINEGKTIRRNHFLVHQLFEKWEPANWTSQPRIDGVRIRLDIRNPDSEFDGDEEKIKSILNELVENSLKHNHGNSNLSIRMYSSDLLNPQDISSPKIPGDRKFLYIEFTDNGQGVPNDKKDWIFQPLKTTSPEDKGSGLGLFIARKTIKKMGGQIREVGEAGKGVRFQIYLPYLSSNAL
ncbi:hypothetical protein B9G53_08020 [Pseudanabaena sp. SR411]|uniref:tetratricopeptide repeat protein n=1 Tax=Pseudanabaena sp. SR411 TaxID=1980935 RepID=UPI000B98EA8A|nr:tetratricopeptide repeat protein [Pseudanabaena sp. SR411]OYQ65344.1 hypothetical protein B9G53_08020 [Pseudanabaena sp. SR411]